MKQRAAKVALGLGMIVALCGCAGMRMKVKTSAGMAIPVECIDRIVGATPDTVCKTMPEPRQAECRGKFLVEFHCWKAVKKK